MTQRALALLATVVAVLGVACGSDPAALFRGGGEPSQETAPASAEPVVARLPGPSEAPLEAELRGGEVAAYPLALAAGDYLRLIVEQRGVDVVVALMDPTGRELLVVDSPTGTEGPETLHAVVEATGTYRVEVRPLSDRAAPGRIRVHQAARRPARTEDRTRVAAAGAFAAAEELRAADDSGSRAAAVASYQRALELWHHLGDAAQEAVTLGRLGQLRFLQGEVLEALEHYREALRLATSLGRRDLETTLLNDSSSAWRRAGRVEEARTAAEQALELARADGNRREETVALNNLALVHRLQGDPWQALVLYERSLAGWRELGEVGGEATTLRNLGGLYLLLHRLPEARDTLLRALTLYRQSGDRAGEAVALTALGSVESLAGELEAARQSLAGALELRRAVGDRRGEAVSLDHLATLQVRLGRWQEARAGYEQALAVFRQVGDRLSEAYTLSNLGELDEQLDDLAGALERYTAALQLFRQMGEVDGEAYVLSRRARARRRLGELEAALADIEAALARIESLRDATRSPALRASYFASVHEYFELELNVLLELHTGAPERGYDALAFEATERSRARNLLEELGGGEQGPVGVGREEELERAIRERERDLRTARGAGVAERELDALEADLRALLLEREKVRTAARRQPRGGTGPLAAQPLGLEEVRRRVLDGDTLLLAYFLGEESSYLFALDQESLTSHRLPPRRQIEEMASKLHELLARSYQRGAQVQTRLVAAALGELLLRPVAERLGGRRLVVIPDGALHLVPFAALALPVAGQPPAEAAPLVVSHEILHLPSASVLAALRHQQAVRAPAPGTLAVLADPIFSASDPRLEEGAEPTPSAVELAARAGLTRAARDAGLDRFERLPFSRLEAEAILGLVPPSERFEALGLAASREVVLSGELRSFRILHFATHGLLHGGHPELSGLVLSLVDAAGQPRDGFLRAYEIADLDLPAELVVLSACRTALGREIEGEGLVGLPRSFLEAGAARVLMSLWDVSDQGTAELMQRFYRRVLEGGQRPAVALRAAQLSMQREERWRAPYYWAGFVLQGEWR